MCFQRVQGQIEVLMLALLIILTSFRHNSATLRVVKLFSPPFEIHLEHQTLPLPQC